MPISPISLGNSFTSGSGATVLGGVSSGLNTQSVISGIVAAQSAQISPLKDQITVNNSQLSALSTLQQLLNTLQTAAALLATPQSPDPTNNLWAVNTSTVTSNTSQPASNFLTASVSSGATAGTYTISNITSLATASTQQTNAFTVSASSTPIVVASGAQSGQFNAGTLTIEGPSGSGTVTLTAGQTLNQVAADFNAANGSTGLTASVTFPSGVPSLTFSNTNTGAPVSFNLATASSNILDPNGVLNAITNSTFSTTSTSTAVVVASGATSGQFNAGTITIAGPSGTANVTLHANDTISDVANDFNAATPTTGLTATVSVNAGVYSLTFTNASNHSVNFSLTDASSHILDSSGVLSAQTTANYVPNPSVDTVVVASGAGTGQFNAGTYSIKGPGGIGSVTLTTGQTLSQVAADFNTAQSTTGISAQVIQTSTGSDTLVFSSTTTGMNTAFDLTLSSTVLSGGTLAGSSTFQSAATGSDAQFDLNGIAVDRSTNAISDLIPDVTFNLLQNTNAVSNANITLSVAPDTSTIAQGITSFATAYNDFLSFYATQTALNSSGTPASSAILYSDTTLRTVYNQLTNEASTIVKGLASTAPNSLAAVGVSFVNTPANGTTPQIDNTLSVDSSALQSALQSNLAAVENVFGSNLSSSSPDVALYKSPTTAGVSNFNLDINQTGKTPFFVVADPSATAVVVASGAATAQFTAGTYTISGPSGSGSVTLTANDSLNQVANDINAATASTGITASVQQSSPGVYELAYTHNGSPTAFDPTTVGLHEGTQYVATYTDSSNTVQHITLTPNSIANGITLTAPSSSVLAGMELVYATNADATGITVNLSQGVADQLNNSITGTLASNTGSLAQDELAIQTKNTTINKQITSITTQVATTRAQLLQQFSALETAISSANVSLNMLNAQQLANSSSGG